MILSDFKQGALEGGGGAGGRGVGPGGGDLGEFTFGKRCGFQGGSYLLIFPRFANGPSRSHKGSVAGSPVGCAPNRPRSLKMSSGGAKIAENEVRRLENSSRRVGQRREEVILNRC